MENWDTRELQPGSAASLAARVRELENRMAINDLYSHYAWLIDSRRWDEVTDEIFAEDAELELGGGVALSATGRKAIRAVFAGFRENLEATAHYITNVRVELHDDSTATAQAYFQSFHWSAENADGSAMRPVDFVGSGVYLDEVRNDDGRWWIVRRSRGNLGPSPLAFGTIPPRHRESLRGWGGGDER